MSWLPRCLVLVLALVVGCATPEAVPPPAPAPEPAVSAPQPEPEREPELPKADMVARVDGQPILRADLEAMVERNMRRYRDAGHEFPPGIETRIRESVLNRMIEDALIAQKAAALGERISEDALAARFDELVGRFRTEQAFAAYLERSGNTLEEMKQDLRRQMLKDAVVTRLAGDIGITEEQVARYYAENEPRFFEREQIRASRILLRVPDGASDDEKERLHRAASKARRRARQPDADFAEIAREVSEGPQASRGGELGWFARGRMPPEFDRAAFALEPGQVSTVVVTGSGFEIIKVWEKRLERQRPFEEVKDSIRTSLEARARNEKRRQILADLRDAAQIETFSVEPEVDAGGAPSAGEPQPDPVEPAVDDAGEADRNARQQSQR